MLYSFLFGMVSFPVVLFLGFQQLLQVLLLVLKLPQTAHLRMLQKAQLMAKVVILKMLDIKILLVMLMMAIVYPYVIHLMDIVKEMVLWLN